MASNSSVVVQSMTRNSSGTIRVMLSIVTSSKGSIVTSHSSSLPCLHKENERKTFRSCSPLRRMRNCGFGNSFKLRTRESLKLGAGESLKLGAGESLKLEAANTICGGRGTERGGGLYVCEGEGIYVWGSKLRVYARQRREHVLPYVCMPTAEFWTTFIRILKHLIIIELNKLI